MPKILVNPTYGMKKSAEAGLADVQYALAYQDYQTAQSESDSGENSKRYFKWLTKAMSQNHSQAFVLASIVASNGAAIDEIPAEKLIEISGKYNNQIDRIPDEALENLRKEIGVYDHDEVLICGRNASENIGYAMGFLEQAVENEDPSAAGQLARAEGLTRSSRTRQNHA